MVSRPTLSRVGYAKEGPGIFNERLRTHADNRDKAMRAKRADIDPVVEEISQLTQPTRTRFMPSTGRGAGNRRGRRVTSPRLLDGHGTRASRILTNGMNSGLSSPSRPWFRLKIADSDLMDVFAVKHWLGEVETIMQGFLQGTNFYEAAKVGYGELGLFGTEACFMESDWRRGMVSHPMTFGEYWIAEGADRHPDSLLRYAPMTCRQIVEKFVADAFDKRVLHWDRVSPQMQSAWDAGNYETVFDIMHLCEPNPAWDPARLDVAGKPWRCMYWDPMSDHLTRMLSVQGEVEQPFYAARWETVGGGDPWGMGPGWDALADLRALQLNAKRLGDGTDLALRPPLVGPGRIRARLSAGSYTAASDVDKSQVFPLYEVPYQALDMLDRSMPRYYRKIDEAFAVDLFMAISEMDGIQPRNNQEIFSRNEEKLTQLGPVIERVNVEKLGVAIDRAFGICSRMGLFPDPPEELQGLELQVDYVSILAQAQRAAGLGTLERSLGFLGNLRGVFEDITDNVDSDAIAREYWERSGAPVSGLRDPEQVAAVRAQRAQQIAAQQARESMPAMQSGAEAARLLAETDLRGEPMLDQMLGG
jgi:hypothetical protein